MNLADRSACSCRASERLPVREIPAGTLFNEGKPFFSVLEDRDVLSWKALYCNNPGCLPGPVKGNCKMFFPSGPGVGIRSPLNGPLV